MLEAKKMNAFFQRIFKNLFNKTYIVTFESGTDEDIEIKHFEDCLMGEKLFPLNKKVVDFK